MRKTVNLLCPAILIAGGIFAYAQPQDPATAPPQQQPESSTPKTKAKPVNFTGMVKAYEPGKSIEVDAKSGPHNYDLAATDMTVTVSPDIKVGSKVKVMEKADSAGRKTVTIEASVGTN
jgi:hypothetical protein